VLKKLDVEARPSVPRTPDRATTWSGPFVGLARVMTTWYPADPRAVLATRTVLTFTFRRPLPGLNTPKWRLSGAEGPSMARSWAGVIDRISRLRACVTAATPTTAGGDDGTEAPPPGEPPPGEPPPGEPPPDGGGMVSAILRT